MKLVNKKVGIVFCSMFFCSEQSLSSYQVFREIGWFDSSAETRIK